MRLRQLPEFIARAGLLALVLGATAAAAEMPLPGQKKPAGAIPAGDDAPAAPSDAEQISQIRRTVEAGQKRLEALIAEHNDPKGEYAEAEAEFQRLDEDLERKKKALQGLHDDGTAEKTKARARLQAEITALEKSRGLAKDRFDLAIEERKTLKEQIATLEEKIQRDREALDHLTGAATVESSKDEKPRAEVPEKGKGKEKEAAPKAPKPDVVPANPINAATAEPKHEPEPADDKDAAEAKEKDKAKKAEEPEAAEVDVDDEELNQAREAEKEKAEAAREAEQEQRSIAERLDSLDRAITLEQKLLANDRRKSDNAQQTKSAVNDEFRTRSLDGASPAELRDLTAKIRKAELRLQETQDGVREHTDRLNELQTERVNLLAQEVAAQKKAQEAKAELESAEARIDTLQNPLHPRNLIPWLIDHGPKIAVLMLLMFVVHWVVQIFCRRIVEAIARRTARGSREEREGRAETLVGVFHNAASLVILGTGGTMVLQEAGVPVAPLLGGAAVFGLAVAFGAQNLIRDYFYGFVILLENQYKLNDVVKLGDVSGQVEKITLRMTVLRDQEGAVHFIPNGQINSVTNMTHGWSRALIDVSVAYKEDIDRVMAILTEIGRTLREDAEFGSSILEDPTMLGVESLGDSAVLVRFFLKTKTLRQWPVRREMLRRIKNRFDQEGIEMPGLTKTIYFRADEPQPAATTARTMTGTTRADTAHRFTS